MLKAYLLKFTTAFVAPIIYHTPADSLISLFGFLLIEFVDSFSSVFLALLFVGALVVIKNAILYVIITLYFPPNDKNAPNAMRDRKFLKLIRPTFPLLRKVVVFFRKF